MSAASIDERKASITARRKRAVIDADQLIKEIADLTKRPCRLDVGEKGWLKIAFDGFRFPLNIAYEQAQELFSDGGVARIREFLAANKSRFKVKAD